MAVKLAIAAVTVSAGAILAAIAGLDHDVQSCFRDATDGRIRLVMDNGAIQESGSWRRSNDGNSCYRDNGATTAPDIVPFVQKPV